MLFFGCQTADDFTHEEHSENASGITIERKSFKDFKRLPQLTKDVYRNKQRFQGRGGELDTLYNFVIDSSTVRAMTKGNDTYYTMSISRGEANQDYFENLVLSEEPEGNRAFLVKYYPDDSYRQRHAFHELAAFTGRMSAQEIDYDAISNKGGSDCTDVTFAYCGNGGIAFPAGPGCCNNSDGGAHIRYGTMRVCVDQDLTIDDPSGGSQGGGGTTAPGGPSTGGSTGSTGSSGTGSPGTGSSGTAGGNTGGGISVPPTYPGTSSPIGGGGGSGSTNGGGTAPDPGNQSPGNPYEGSQNPGTGGPNPGTGGGKKPMITGPVYIPTPSRTVAYLYANISAEQSAWLNSHPMEATTIHSFTAADNYGTYSMNFVRQFIQSCIDTGLNLDFNKSLKSPLNVDMSAVSGTSPEEIKFNKIYEKLMLSPKFQMLFLNVFSKSDKVSVKFNIVDASVIGNVLGRTTHQMVNGKLQININISKNLLINQVPHNYGSNIIVAKVIAHECLHAFIQYIRINSLQHPNLPIANIDDMTFAEAIAEYYSIYQNDAEHYFIADKLLPHLISMMNDIYTQLIPADERTFYENSTLDYPGAGINEPWSWNNFLKNLCTQGLLDTNYFSTNFYTHLHGNESIIQIINQINTTRYFHYVRASQQMSKIVN